MPSTDAAPSRRLDGEGEYLLILEGAKGRATGVSSASAMLTADSDQMGELATKHGRLE